MKRIFSSLCLATFVFAEPIVATDFSNLKKTCPKIQVELLDIHLKLYEGYVAQVNYINSKIDKEEDSFMLQSLRKQYGFEYDGMRLHELYFGALGGNGKLPKKEKLSYKIVKEFGSLDCFKSEVKSYAKTRGIGWVILFGNVKNGEIKLSWTEDHEKGFLSGWVPICVIDLWEHAYISQFGLDKGAYIDLVFSYLDWRKMNARYVGQCNTAKNGYVQFKK